MGIHSFIEMLLFIFFGLGLSETEENVTPKVQIVEKQKPWTELEKLKSALKKLEFEMARQNSVEFFHVNQFKGPKPKGQGSIVPFGKKGEFGNVGYDAKVGKFRSKQGGVYSFKFGLYREKPMKSASIFNAELVKVSKSKKTILCGSYSVNEYGTAGCAATTILFPGDEVYVFLRRGGYFSHPYNYFSGVRIGRANKEHKN